MMHRIPNRLDNGPRRAPTTPIFRMALRDAVIAGSALLILIVVGSDFLRWLDPALLGYLGAAVAATVGVTFRTSAFWRRPASAFYGRALLKGIRDWRRARVVLAGAGRHLGAQELIARRSRGRWLAHLLMSLGTLASFAITLPLVFGWLHFEAADPRSYRIVFFTFSVGTFAIDGPAALLLFHGLALAAVAVVLGAGYFLTSRLRRRAEAGAVARFHVAPLILLLAVAVTGLALPLSRDTPSVFRFAALAHEITVVLLLVALPFGKLSHVFIRPLQLGSLVVKAATEPRVMCRDCGVALAPAAQLSAVEHALGARGHALTRMEPRCPACRRRLLATAQARLLGADFQPRLTGVRPAPPKPAEAA